MLEVAVGVFRPIRKAWQNPQFCYVASLGGQCPWYSTELILNVSSITKLNSLSPFTELQIILENQQVVLTMQMCIDINTGSSDSFVNLILTKFY